MTPSGTAVVTGATRGIGASVCEALLRHFDQVVGLGRSDPDTPIAGVRYARCDVTSEFAVADTFADIGPVGALINNAGVSSSNPVTRTTLAEWESSFAVNATAAFLCTKQVLASMLDLGQGSIVTVASITSIEAAPYISAYAASKHAVLGFMKVLAAELDGTGVNAGTVCPTYVRTPMTTATIENIAERTGCSLAEAEHKLARVTPHGRILEASEVADSVLELIAGTENGRIAVLDGAPTT